MDYDARTAIGSTTTPISPFLWLVFDASHQQWVFLYCFTNISTHIGQPTITKYLWWQLEMCPGPDFPDPPNNCSPETSSKHHVTSHKILCISGISSISHQLKTHQQNNLSSWTVPNHIENETYVSQCWTPRPNCLRSAGKDLWTRKELGEVTLW